MDLSRREFFRRLGSRQTGRKLAGFVSQGLGSLLGFVQAPGGSVEEAGRALRNMRRKRSQRPRQSVPATCDGTRNANSGRATLSDHNSGSDEADSRTSSRPDMENWAPPDSEGPPAPT